MGGPVEIAGIDDHAADRLGVAVEVLRGGVDHHVGAPFERAAQVRRREGVVDDERHAVVVGDGRELLDIENVHGGVGHRLAEQQLGVGAEGGGDLVGRGVGVDVAHLDAEFLEGDREQVHRPAVDGRRAHKMVPRFEQVEQRDERGALAARGAQGPHAALERRNLLLDEGDGRVGDARVHVPVGSEVEQGGNRIRRIVLVRGALIDGQRAGLAVARLVSGMEAGGLELHRSCSLRWAARMGRTRAALEPRRNEIARSVAIVCEEARPARGR